MYLTAMLNNPGSQSGLRAALRSPGPPIIVVWTADRTEKWSDLQARADGPSQSRPLRVRSGVSVTRLSFGTSGIGGRPVAMSNADVDAVLGSGWKPSSAVSIRADFMSWGQGYVALR